MTEFRTACRGQARLAMSLMRKLWLPRVSTGGALTKAGGLLLAPFIMFTFWMFQFLIWLLVSVPVLAYAFAMALIGGGFSRELTRPIPPPLATVPGPPPPDLPMGDSATFEQRWRELRRLSKLHHSGAMTDADFTAAKWNMGRRAHPVGDPPPPAP